MKRFILLILITIVFVTACFSYGFLIGTKSFTFNETTIQSSKIPQSFHYQKLAVFSDLYVHNNYTLEQFSKAVTELNTQAPTMVFFLGDVIEPTQFSQLNQQQLLDILHNIQALGGKFFTLGEQDLANKEALITLFETAGFIYLAPNQIHSLYYQTLDSLQVAAFDPQTDTATMQSVLSQLDQNRFTLVVNHFPDSFAISQTYTSVDVQFSGHSLGGQINVPGLRNLLAPAQAQRFPVSVTNGSPQLYVSTGLGNLSDLPIRLFNAPSIDIYTLQTIAPVEQNTTEQ